MSKNLCVSMYHVSLDLGICLGKEWGLIWHSVAPESHMPIAGMKYALLSL